MKKIFLTVLTCAGLFSSLFAQSWGFYASALYLKVNNNTPEFYDVKTSTYATPGDQNISGDPGGHLYSNLNSDVQLNGPVTLEGAEIKTFKNGTANVCGATMYYLIYPQGARPSSPTFTAAPLTYFGDCSGSAFGSGGPCNTGDQKWQVSGLDKAIASVIGSFTLEFYFDILGSATGGCDTHIIDNNGGANYATSVAVSTVLPVTLIAFNAIAAGSNVKLSWATSQEINASHFEIQRSVNGKDFVAIASVTASNKAIGSVYNFTDVQPLSGKSYYRLNTVDKDGKKVLSSIRDVFVLKNLASITPNPARNFVNVTNAAGSVLNIISIEGKVLKTITIQSANQRVYFTLPNNLYFMKVTGDNQNSIFKIVVKN